MAEGSRGPSVTAFDNWNAAAKHAIQTSAEGDLVFIQADSVDETTEFEQSLLAEAGVELKR